MDEPTARRLAIGAALNDVLRGLKRDFVGKDEVVDLLGVCLVGNENLFLLGPPGTAKSALVFELGRRLSGRIFEYLLTRFTEPSELFGPFDIRRLREGELVTNTEGMLPEASLVFLDELLNANSAILNSLLTVLNERVFRRGRETRRLPLLMAVGASNHLPEDDALAALFDRFLLRVRCDQVPTDRLGDVLDAGWRIERTRSGRLDPASGESSDAAARVAIDDLRELSVLITEVDLTPVRGAIVRLVARLRDAGVTVSDRRAVKMQRLVAASSVLCGRLEAAVSDLWVFRYIWERDEDEEVLAAIVQETVDTDEAVDDAHPRARARSAPDPEMLRRDLDDLAARLGEGAERASSRDRLGALAGRCQWVEADEARRALLEDVERLWRRLEAGPGAGA